MDTFIEVCMQVPIAQARVIIARHLLTLLHPNYEAHHSNGHHPAPSPEPEQEEPAPVAPAAGVP